MRYLEFKNVIRDKLLQNTDGLTWAELKEQLRLPYDQPCPTWVRRMEQDFGLVRVKGSGRALVWKIHLKKPDGQAPRR